MSEAEHVPQMPSTASATTPALSDTIERLLANPELLSNVASAIGLSVPPSLDAQSEDALPASSEKPADVLPTTAPSTGTGDLGHAIATLAPLLSGFSSKDTGKTASDDPRACLLRALKPYVNRRRAEAIDTIIQLSRVSEVMKKLNEKGG